MKKIYNLFSLVVIVNSIMAVMPFRVVVADGAVNDVGLSEVADDFDGAENGEDGENESGEDDDADADEVDEVGDDDEILEEVVLPILYIRAINPGYKIDGINNVGEMIEIGKSSDDLILLAGVTVRYTNSSGNETVLVEFPENSYMAGETILLRFDSAPGSELSNITYGTTLALKAGPVALFAGDELLDSVCWTNKDGCLKDFASTRPTTLKRDLATGEFEHIDEYEPDFDAESLVVMEPIYEGETENCGGENESSGEDGGDSENDDSENNVGDEYGEEDEKSQDDLNEKPGDGDGSHEPTEVGVVENENKVEIEKDSEGGAGGEVRGGDELKNEAGGELEEEKTEKVSKCVGLQFSEILSYYVETQAEQFIELHNVGLEAVLSDECLIRYKGKTYGLTGEVGADEYMVRRMDDFKLTKNPTSSNTVELLNESGEVMDAVEYYNGQKKGTSWALVDYEAEEKIWRVTYAVTPGEANIYQEFKSCDEGQYLDPLTGRCKKLEDEAEEKTCAEGQYLNPLTGRCKKIEVEEEKICSEGYYLNEETGRCKKVVVETVKTCDKGYYLNEETGRCRKIVENNGAEYELKAETYEENSSFVALYAVFGVVGVGLVYVIYEFRREIGRFFRRLFGR